MRRAALIAGNQHSEITKNLTYYSVFLPENYFDKAMFRLNMYNGTYNDETAYFFKKINFRQFIFNSTSNSSISSYNDLDDTKRIYCPINATMNIFRPTNSTKLTNENSKIDLTMTSNNENCSFTLKGHILIAEHMRRTAVVCYLIFLTVCLILAISSEKSLLDFISADNTRSQHVSLYPFNPLYSTPRS